MRVNWLDSSRDWARKRCWAGCALAGALAFAGSLHAQAPPTGSGHATRAEKADTGGSGERIGRAVLTRPQYSGLNGAEKATVTFFAVHALLIVESGRCADARAEEAAVETFLLLFLGLSHKGLQPVLALPNTRKTELVNNAMELASEEEGKTEWCGGHLLPANAVEPLYQRRARARNVLLQAILAANADPPEEGGEGRSTAAKRSDSASTNQ